MDSENERSQTTINPIMLLNKFVAFIYQNSIYIELVRVLRGNRANEMCVYIFTYIYIISLRNGMSQIRLT